MVIIKYRIVRVIENFENYCSRNNLLTHLCTTLRYLITEVLGVRAEPMQPLKKSLLTLLNERASNSKLTQVPESKRAYIMESDNQLILKTEKRAGEAAQEFAACQLARILLPRSLSPPESWGYIGGTLIIEKQVGRPFGKSNRDHVSLATDFLSKLHSVEISDNVFQILSEHGFNYYFGKRLNNRLYYEVKQAQLAYGSIKQLSFIDPYASEVCGLNPHRVLWYFAE